MPYKILKDGSGFSVWKVDEKGNKVEKKNKEPYKSRGEALPYLKALYSHEPKAEASLIIASEQLILGAVHFEADEENPRFMRFHDAVLARAEANANRDELDNHGIEELASTIAGTAIDLEHDPTKNLGFYTAGRAVDGALRVDGVVWLDRCRALGVSPAEIEDGTFKLSIEAEADTAECSICHTVHNDVTSYCKHLRAKVVYGANRILKGLRAVGGALTKKPAGSDTGFNSSNLYMVASHQEEEDMDNKLEAADKREDVSDADKKRAEKEYGDVKYADEENKKYPVDTEEHARAALAYFSMPKNSSKYSPEERKAIMSKIKRAAKHFGIEVSDDEKSKSESSLKETAMAEKEKEETPEEEKKESPEEEKKEQENKTEACDMPNGENKPEMKADDYATMSKKVADMAAELEKSQANLKAAQDAEAESKRKYGELEAQVTAMKASLDEAQNVIKAHRVTELKAKLVGSVMDDKEFEKRQEELLALPDMALELLARVKRESTVAKPEENNRLAAAETVPDNGKVRIILN